jgi:hypothetical protein
LPRPLARYKANLKGRRYVRDLGLVRVPGPYLCIPYMVGVGPVLT